MPNPSSPNHPTAFSSHATAASAANDPFIQAHVQEGGGPGNPQRAGQFQAHLQGQPQASTGLRRATPGPTGSAPSPLHQGPHAPRSGPPEAVRPSPPVAIPNVPKHTPKLWVRDALSLLAAGLAVAQALGTLGEIDMKPGLFIHGGLGRLVEFLEGKGWVPQWLVWMKLVGNWAICAFWSFLALAGSRLMCEAVPGFQSGREQQWFFLQKRRTYVWPLLVLVTSHAAGNWLAMKGWWLAAVPLELMGHATIAFLLYVLWVPESRAALAVVVDVVGRGHNSRVSFSQTDYRFSFSRRWDTIRHDNLNSAVLRNSIFSRLMGTAHLELIWREPRSQKINRILLKGIGFKDEVSQLVGFLNGPFREGKPLSYMHPSTMVGQTHNNEPTT